MLNLLLTPARIYHTITPRRRKELAVKVSERQIVSKLMQSDIQKVCQGRISHSVF